jgi:hypothetical protein
MAKTELFARQQNAGAFVFTDESRTTGNIFFVDSNTGTDSAGYGRNPDAPCATLDYAIGLCTASKADRIYVMPGHAETIVGAAGVALDVAGVKVVGLGQGRNRPTFTFTTSTGASFDISAANCHVENLVFINGIDAQTAVVNVTAASVTIKGCEFVLADSSTQAAVGILVSAAGDRLLVEDCWLHGTSDAGVTNAISFGACDDAIIRNNVIAGAFAVSGAINNSAAAINVLVWGNTLLNRTADGDNKTVVFHASTVGVIANNRSAIIDSSGPAPFTAAAGFVGGNYSASAVGVSAGTLI